MSLWAVASLVCGVVAIPPLCFLAILLGVFGLVQTRRGRGYKGRWLAIGGIALGVLASIGVFLFMAWWHVNVRRPLIEGPREALVAGFRGDGAAFAAQFVAPGPEDEAAAFLAELSRRYGAFRTIAQDRTRAGTVSPETFDPTRVVVPYRITFDRGEVGADAEFVRSEPDGFPMILRWGYLIVRDPEAGDLAYPAGIPAIDRGGGSGSGP